MIAQLELETQEYSVFITDEKRTSSGSGVLFYPGSGNRLYIFTCAHVLDGLEEPFQMYSLFPVNREQEIYQVEKLEATREQVKYSPIDKVSESAEGVIVHSIDAAVICLEIKEEISFETTDYVIGEVHKGDGVLAQGFPGSEKEIEELLNYVEGTYGRILHNAKDKEVLLWQIEDTHVDSGNRVYELNGFSGSPVWSLEADEKTIVGLFTSGVGRSIYRGKVHALKMEAIRSIMKIFFQIRMESRILGIPNEEIAPQKDNPTYISKEVQPEIRNLYDEWLVVQTEKVRAYIDDVKFQNAIDTAKMAIKDQRFEKCSKKVACTHIKHLLYCYEACLLDDEYEALEQEMQKRGFLEGHDPLRWITFNFGKKQFKETIAFTEALLQKGDLDERVKIVAEVYASISRAYVEDAPVEETIGKFLDEKECLNIKIEDMGTEAHVYQMLGYVYGEHYKQYVKSVRCLNRAYRLGQDHAVLESLGCAYHLLAIHDALKEDHTIEIEKVDRSSLYKARECFLILLDKADELYLRAMMKREGGILYDTFFFEQDNYRILTLYPILIKNSPDDAKMKRDFEMRYAKTVCQYEQIDLTQFHHLTKADKILLSILKEEQDALHRLDFTNSEDLRRISNLDKKLYNVIDKVEQNLAKIDEKEQLLVRALLLNLYRWGKYLFGWNIIFNMERHLEFIQKNGKEEMAITFENFIYECSHEPEEAEERYIHSWEKNPCFELWKEILQFYKRNHMLDKADAMFESLFTEHTEYVESEPEYAFRAYIGYIIDYQRDLKKALHFYLLHKNEMKDEIVRELWESELMMCTNSFNNPDEFVEMRNVLVEQGLMSENEFHRISLIAYMCNLDSVPLVNKDGLPEKAQEIVDSLKFHFNTHIEVKDSIGKRYRRQDAIGTPFCVTVDGDTLTEGTVTLRYRDSMKQERVPVEKLREIIEDRVSITSLLKKLQ